jgi:hypothetical protein
MIHEKTKEYMERAEKLKKHITEQEAGNKKGPAAIGANGKSSNGGGKGKCVQLWLWMTYMSADSSTFAGRMKTTTQIRRSSGMHYRVPYSQRSQTSDGRMLLVWTQQRRR